MFKAKTAISLAALMMIGGALAGSANRASAQVITPPPDPGVAQCAAQDSTPDAAATPSVPDTTTTPADANNVDQQCGDQSATDSGVPEANSTPESTETANDPGPNANVDQQGEHQDPGDASNSQ
ncbi:MAG: hypothetical protein ACYDBJ_21995 [Aggregatilineales bacterium]